ncbi:hypothetical protein NLJ89_g4800 [Agrocybe chaxingu]|uniref:3-beta hydroxysteroid dehydrogenase/isomerase domain-containing protein n=1 Tax=Agrocybe chaxingu TaxID=84603 RepID=A0A9W8MU80_9AGAR|nr:hypothetical protein NLJ89_g4800 [Agrocybe chaxingu]
MALIERSRPVNVGGTQNVIDAARKAGASVLIYTSSGSVCVKCTRFLLWPWETEPPRFVQVIDDDDTRLPKRHDEFFSNYAATKIQAERLVRDANGLSTADGVVRTGCIRPGNGIFGPRGDMLCGAYLVRQHNPTWIEPVVQSFVYVENCVVAHLLYEARLLEPANSPNPDIGGQAFCVADPGPTPTYGDVYKTLETLTDGETQFPSFSPTLMLLISFLIEGYYRLHYYFASQSWGAPLVRHLPEIKGDIINLQPALFALTNVHLIFDDSRARLPPSKGGLGYKGKWTTLEGLVKTVEEHQSGIGRSETRSGTAGVSFGFKRKTEKVVKAKETLVPEPITVVAPVEVLTAQ